MLWFYKCKPLLCCRCIWVKTPSFPGSDTHRDRKLISDGKCYHKVEERENKLTMWFFFLSSLSCHVFWRETQIKWNPFFFEKNDPMSPGGLVSLQILPRIGWSGYHGQEWSLPFYRFALLSPSADPPHAVSIVIIHVEMHLCASR